MSLHNSSLSISEKKPVGQTDIASSSSKMAKLTSQKYRHFLTLSLYMSFMAIGMTASLTGPTFLHLTYILQTDIEKLGITYMFQSMGYLFGSLLCGLFYDRFNSELQFAFVTFFQGAALMLCPWAPNVHVFYVIDFLKATAIGYLSAGGQGYAIGLWLEHKFKGPILQGLHGILSVGATFAPYIILPFLTDLPSGDSYGNVLSNQTTEIYANMTEFETVDVDIVRYGYAIVGGMIICISMCFFVAFCMLRPSCLKQNKESTGNTDQKKKTEQKKHDTWKIFLILFLEFFFYAFYSWCELIPGNYLSPFVIKGLEWEIKYGPIITSVFWGFHGLGRIAAIPISFFITPGKMVAINLLFTFIGLLMMVVAPFTSDLILWFAVAIASFAMASTFATLILWTSNYIEITGSVGACFLTGSAFGVMVGGTLTGYLFQSYSHLWVCILSLLGCICDIVLYSLIYVFAQCSLKEKKASYSIVKQ